MTSYTSETTTEELASNLSASIKGKVVLVTGVSPNGLGAAFASIIAKYQPALLILAGRDLTKGQQTANYIAEIAPSVPVRLLKLDLSSQTQVREAAREVNGFNEEYIDVLVNNAGIMACPYRLTGDGIESHFGANHIGHFLFTNLIMDKLVPRSVTSGYEKPRTARVVNVASNGYRLSPVRFEDWNFGNGKYYDPWRAYGQSKTANMLFSRSLASKLSHRGLVSVSIHPGVINTNLACAVDEEGWHDLRQTDREMGLDKVWDSVQFLSLSQGVATHVFASFDESITPDKNNGAYLEYMRVYKPEEIHSWGRDEYDAEKLWKLSEKLVGEKFLY